MKLKTNYLLTGSIFSLIFMMACGYEVEEPNYQVIEKGDKTELRKYDSYLVAQVEVESSFEEAGNKAFRLLFKYIDGNNSKNESIAMTAPVEQQTEDQGEKIAMTAPVEQISADDQINLVAPSQGKFLISFAMPAKYTLASLPTPNDDRIKIVEKPSRLVLVRYFSGRWTEENYRENEEVILEELANKNLKATSSPIFARYNDPWTLWHNRRNEILIPVIKEED